MNPTVNEHFLKFSSQIPFHRALAYGEDITVVIDGKQYIFNCVSQKGKDNQDGTIDMVYSCKTLSE
jgi:hypothetical protein